MSDKYLHEGEMARIKSTGQVVEIKRISNHGFSVVKFKTGGDYMILNEKLAGVDVDQDQDYEIQH